MAELNGWESFYVIVGSSAGALIGLQFVLLTLLASRPLQQRSDVGSAFGTPTVVHFSVVLFLSAVGCAPWSGSVVLMVLWGAISLIGIIYIFRVTMQMKKQKAYRPVMEDWIFHAVIPFTAYVLTAIASVGSRFSVANSLFIVATAMLALLFTGVHNSWDAVTYSVFKITDEIRSTEKAADEASK